MSKSVHRFPGRVFLVVAIGAILGLGCIVLVKWLLSSTKDDATIEQVNGWADRWRDTRSCLVGTHPWASSATLAIELRDATTSRLRSMYTRCVLLVERNKRPEGPAARDARVERDWAEPSAVATSTGRLTPCVLAQHSTYRKYGVAVRYGRRRDPPRGLRPRDKVTLPHAPGRIAW